ncbi:putative neurogenic locus notch -like protein 1-like [Scophthalmus maximus]|uniref:Neurogenic locus notch homolog protein 1 n=1 Tax=Scophthalmus maximus TaxID=52904 RepID=A0A2U9BUG3_SCOMX|nr:putative neurogenic locus notch -like protein 1-like [Scophthalmus maximus]
MSPQHLLEARAAAPRPLLCIPSCAADLLPRATVAAMEEEEEAAPELLTHPRPVCLLPRCRDGYLGSRCQFRDPCTSSPCMNGAACRPVTRGNAVDFSCTCKLGYADRHCLTPVHNECVSSPCRHGGTCELETLQTYKCRCPPGWSGKLCQQADPCASNPCANSGQCSAIESIYVCTCTPFFSGKTCKQDVNECDASPCKNGGTCVNQFGGYACQCPQEYTGRHCESRYLPCSPSPCHNGGTCIQKGETSYECTCVPGFSGKSCNYNIDDCPGHECQNGGTCVDGVNTYNCQCRPEFTGQLCTEDVDECQLMPNACQNGGTCHNTYGSYQCVCVNGWTGDDCSENIDDCASAACYAGSTCHDRVASFYCECPHGRTGLLCQLDDACISNPCQKGSNCDTNPVNGNHFCTCPLGYVGASCDQDVDECALGSNPCEHAGKCINTKGSFQCKCQQGYVGPRCELDINECMSNPCMNEATCLDQIGDFHCICMPGYEGDFCQIDTDECANGPCLNNGKCIDKINSFHCQCPTGFTGNLCQIDIDECASTPCKNGAKCTDGPNKYTCECTEGYTGRHCETDINECSSDPCHYGTCIDGLASFSCHCKPGYTGTMCNINIDECAINPCHNGGTCIDGINGFTCVCPDGYHDATCFSQVNECLSNPCIHGHCDDKINGYKCLCDSGWSGKNCDINNNECESNPCTNGGTCKDMTSGYVCTCRMGFTGPNCQTNINECASNPCLNQGTCIDDVAGYKCNCVLPYTGENCETLMAPCGSKPCKHGGTCQESEDFQSFSCVCPEGWQGQTCEVDIKECVKNPCRNGATCLNTLGSYRCGCKPGFTGRNCETDVDDCQPNPCSNGGLCDDEVNGFLCTCTAGFRGTKCEEDINECESNPCKNGANCTDCVNSYTCTCPAGFSGIHCENNTPDCTESSCFNGGSCMDGINTFTCLCPPGFTGSYCQHDINECDSKPCLNGGTCQDSYGTYKCTCPHGYTGLNCQNLVRWCDLSPCKNGGTCWQRGTTYSCECETGWTGLYCDVPSVSCEVAAKQRGVDVAHLCRNSGQCLDAGNVHYCHCQVGYTGSYCEEQVDECTPNPCQNGAACTDFLGGYTCKCLPGYVGTNCSDEINECLSQPCQNGGTCIDLINTYKCSCPRGTQGVHCEINLDDCNPFTDPVTNEPKCFNKGKCVDRVGGYHCTCPLGYVGERCEGDVNECLSNPCDPRGTHSCIQLTNNYRCECRTGYTGQRCDTVFDGCKGKPCRNGGTCAVASNTPHGFICKCPPGFTGSTCEYDAQACGSLHCRNGGTCISGHKNPKCLCGPSFTGPECQYPTDSPCNSNPCYNGGTCEYTLEAPFYHCVCPTNFNGLRCHILDYSFLGGFGHDIPPPSEVEVACEIPQCKENRHNSVCDVLCNNHACGWDNGDCSLNFDDPWKNCSASLQCWRYFNNGKCDAQCDNAGCLYDGFDCQNLEGQCNPLYDQYCKDHYADGHCDQGCNNAECEWDGLDCANNMPEKLALGQLVLVVHITPEQLLSNSSAFLRELSSVLRTNVIFSRTGKGEVMVYPYYGSEHELKKYNVKRSVAPWPEAPGEALSAAKRSLSGVVAGSRRRRRELDHLQIKGSIVHLEVDNRQCFQQSTECFQSTNDAAAFLGALASSGTLDVSYTIKAVYSDVDQKLSPSLYPIYLVLGGVGILAFLGVGMVAARKRRHEHGRLWLPEGFKTTETSKKKRREPVGEDSVGLKPLKNTSDISLMDDAQNDWGEDEPSDAKRFRFDEQSILEVDDQTDHRQWTQQHLDAADLRIASIAPTPPQGEIESDSMDVNVRGPDGFTPLMIASCSGGGLETGNSEEEEDASANVINDFIYQGANLHNQTDRTGETALHLAARYARSDAAKRLLEASADANIQDNMGRTPLHAAVAADAQGVFQILIRNRATDLDSRMHDGTTPLILAARLAVEGMVEELINCHADVNAIDDFGKSALHWAAAVNNLEAAIVLLKNGANKDMQNNKEETPLFLAAREGSYETAKVLLEHFANREITDHMDRLPRDIAQERMHHDIVRLMDEYNLVRSPPMHGGSLGTTLSPPLCSPNGYLGSMKPLPQGQGHGKKARKPSAKGIGCKEGKDMKVKKKNSQDGKSGNLLDSSAVLSPVDSLESPHGYVSDVASPPMMTSPFQQSPSMALNHLQVMSDPHLPVNHMVMPNKQELARMQFDPLPPRLTHLPVSGSGGPGAMNGQCDWLSRMHGSMGQPGQFNPMRGGPGGQGGLHQGGQHGIMTALHNGLSQMMTYQGIQGTRLGPQPHILQQQAQQMQQMQNLQQLQQQQSIQLQHQNSNPTNSQNFISGELSSPELQPGTGGSSMPIHTILPQETQIMPSSISQSMASTQFLTPPSQHSYSGPMDNTPNHQVQVPDHPFLTPSPGSPDQWSSSSPHSNLSDWSEGISSPPTSMQSQIGHIPEQFK